MIACSTNLEAGIWRFLPCLFQFDLKYISKELDLAEVFSRRHIFVNRNSIMVFIVIYKIAQNSLHRFLNRIPAGIHIHLKSSCFVKITTALFPFLVTVTSIRTTKTTALILHVNLTSPLNGNQKCELLFLMDIFFLNRLYVYALNFRSLNF